MEDVFTTIKLPIAGKCEILEGKGKHYFKALLKAKGDSFLMVKYLIIELAIVGGEKLTESKIDEMHIRDISFISEVIGSMLSNNYINGV